MLLTDTHCHIQELGTEFTGDDLVRNMWLASNKQDPDEIIRDAHEADVNRLICVGTTLSDSERAVDFVEKREHTWASIGIHPHEAQLHQDTVVKAQFKNLLDGGPAAKKIVAVGECGLDYFYTHSPKEAQVDILKFQIELALGHELPLIFHVREAFDDFWPIFESYTTIGGVLHSFTDSQANLERAVQHGLFIGVNGIATFTKNPEQLAMYKAIPLRNLLLETDAPFLTPAPYRGTICEPKHVRVTAEYLSKLRDISLKELAAATTRNAAQLFGLEKKLQ